MVGVKKTPAPEFGSGAENLRFVGQVRLNFIYKILYSQKFYTEKMRQ